MVYQDLNSIDIIKVLNKMFCNMLLVVSWLLSEEMDTATQVQILGETDCISHSTNTLGKGMNPIILPPAMGK